MSLPLRASNEGLLFLHFLQRKQVNRPSLRASRAPTLVYVRPSNEALPRARVPEAQDQHGCPSHPFYRGGSASKKDRCLLPHLPIVSTTRNRALPLNMRS